MENETTNSPRPKRKYSPRQPKVQVPEVNSNITELERGLIPLMAARREANMKVNLAAHKANLANQELQTVRSEFDQIEGEIQYTLQVIGQLKGVPVQQGSYISPGPQYGHPAQYQPPSPSYTPAIPYPQFPGAAEGVSSMPAANRGLYPDATDRLESAEDVRSHEMQHRGR